MMRRVLIHTPILLAMLVGCSGGAYAGELAPAGALFVWSVILALCFMLGVLHAQAMNKNGGEP
jgi:hypothetical protein